MKTGLLAQKLAEELIKIDTSDKGSIDSAVTLLVDWARINGLIVRTIPKSKAIIVQTNESLNNPICFVTHVDVVPANGWEEAFQPTIKGNYLLGRGAVDDKGPLAICFETMTHFVDEHNLAVSCLVVTDEETTNLDIQQVLGLQTIKPKYFLVADGGTHNTFDIGQKGVIRFTVTATAVGGHSAFEQREKSAILNLLDFISFLQTEAGNQQTHQKFTRAFINISMIESKSVPYGLPTEAQAALEIQFPPPQTSKMWLKIIQAAQKHIKGITFAVQYMCEPHLMVDQELIQTLQQSKTFTCITTGGVNLAKDLSLAGMAAVSHCPVSTYSAHCHDEKILVSDFGKGVDKYVSLIRRLSKQMVIGED